MTDTESQAAIRQFLTFLDNKEFPCVGARAARAGQQIKCMAADHMACPGDDTAILQFLYDFVDDYRNSNEIFHSAAIVFKGPQFPSEEIFDRLLWTRLQALADLDSKNYTYDKRVDADPASANFSFSLKEEAFFIIGLHPASSRRARQFRYPTLIFNPHGQFERLRESGRYDMMKSVIRKRDLAFSGSVNPMLNDFGESSEARQYSGRGYDAHWQCPLSAPHGKT